MNINKNWIKTFKGWFYLNIFNFICLDISNPFRTMKRVKGVFVPLRCVFRHGKNIHREIYNYYFNNPSSSFFKIKSRDVMWKDKYDTPRHESDPIIWIRIFNYDFIWTWDLYPHLKETKLYVSDWWEQVLWYVYYNDCDLEKAKEKWPWADFKTDESTWNNKFVLKK
jgi:hypothetical protein